jgi:hypothetical protein
MEKATVRVSLVPAEKPPRTKDDDEEDWDMTGHGRSIIGVA